jgi:hypothetical protein
MRRKKTDRAGYARLLDAWIPPSDSGEPLGCVATSYTFSAAFFEEECLGRFVHLETDASEHGAAFLVEREEKFSQLICAAALVDQRHARGLRSLRWDLLAARLPGHAILHAKVSLLLWTNAARIIVASANLTEDGYRRNQEVFGVIDYHPGATAPLNLVNDLVGFLRDAVIYADPDGQALDPAVLRWRMFLDRFASATQTWGAPEATRRSGAIISTILTGPNRESAYAGVQAAWRESAPPADAWIVSPFFDPPESRNAPAQEIWNSLRQRGETSVCYVLPGETSEGSEVVRLLGPETLRYKPANRPVRVEFERLQLEPTRPLHAKCLWFEGRDCFLYVCGSSNFTSAGLGIGSTKNLEANLAYFANFNRNPDVFQACDEAWLSGEPISGELILDPPPETGEDGPAANDLLLPNAFGSAIFVGEKDGTKWIEFTLNGVPPQGWCAHPEDAPDIFLDESIWRAHDVQQSLRLSWPANRPPTGFRITWRDSAGAAWWPVNVRDGNSLPPPAELADLPLDVLIEILTSAKPLYLAMARWLNRKASAAQSNEAVLLDPHQRVDTSTFLLQRTRRVSWALAALRSRLDRPVASDEALEWRLRGPVGVQAIMRAISKEARSSEERAFLLAELMLELGRVRPNEMPGGLAASKIRAALRTIIAEIKVMLDAELLSDAPALRTYLNNATAAV